jgi:hypothetical protein
MLGYLQPNGTLTFKKSYEDSDYYNFDYFNKVKKFHVGNRNLKSNKGKGSRVFKMKPTIRRNIENATVLMRHFQKEHNKKEKVKSKQFHIKLLTLTLSDKSYVLKGKNKTPNNAVSHFFNYLRISKKIQSYWWVKENHPKHFKNYGIKKPHYHCLVSFKAYTTKKEILQAWRNQVGTETEIIDLKNIEVRNKYNSFQYQIVRYVSKYCTKGCDVFDDKIFERSQKLNHKTYPLLYSGLIKNILKNISKNENLTENEVIYYRTHWNQAYLKKNNVKTYLRLKEITKYDEKYMMLYNTRDKNDNIGFKQKKESSQSESQAEFKREIKKINAPELEFEKNFIY